MGAKDTAAKVLRTVAKTTKNVVEGAVAIARAVRGRKESDRDQSAERRSREQTRPRGRRSEGGEAEQQEETPTTSEKPETARREAETGEDEGQEEQPTDQEASQQEPEAELVDIWGVGDSRAESLRELGFESVADVAAASVDELQELSGVGATTAEKMKDSAEELVG
jgi:predicted flap endonuclease-1-like 5' DNA nuclease